MNHLKKIIPITRQLSKRIKSVFHSNVYFGKASFEILKNSTNSSIIFFPYIPNRLSCGLTGIISFHEKEKKNTEINLISIVKSIEKIEKNNLHFCINNSLSFHDNYLGGKEFIISFAKDISALKLNSNFFKIFKNQNIYSEIKDISNRIKTIADSENKIFLDFHGRLGKDDVEFYLTIMEKLLDISWSLSSEILDNLIKIKMLIPDQTDNLSYSRVSIFREINTVLNSLNFLEVRGRDSAGISLMFIFDMESFENIETALKENQLSDNFKKRSSIDVLKNRVITLNKTKDEKGNKSAVINLTYKFASEVGSLGANVSFLRNQITNDSILQLITGFPCKNHTVSAHTRWASVGAINEPNCHPLDNRTVDNKAAKNTHKINGIIHVCLNGDIDNYAALKKKYEKNGCLIQNDITTDTKIIPLIIEKYFNKGNDINEAFRLAVNDFEGSHAISMHTDLAPGKIFLAQKGSGQAIFIGLAEDLYMPASEIYGFIEMTSSFLKLEGKKSIKGKNGYINGQIFVLDQNSKGSLNGISANYYDGTSIELKEKDIKHTEITSRDINRQNFPHYFLKEISESYISVEKTLLNRWKIDKERYTLLFDEQVFPESLQNAFAGDQDKNRQIKKVFFVGQGTAGVAAMACADILNYYLGNFEFMVRALKASELSGFMLDNFNGSQSMSDVLVIAISQSGTTADTNRAVDMIKERGAHAIAIVNRRDSDLTFKVDGVMYTSSGRDIEMSVASTKAFYSQIIAGALLGLKIALLKGRRDERFIDHEIQRLLEIPSCMQKILNIKDKIKVSARKLAPAKTYWATVGSGPNKIAADEIRIKLSELCYKTISSDFVEDKKHIDLSSEPLIIVCAAGTNKSALNDIVKDVAIFHAHKSSVVVIADEGEGRFNEYAEDVIHVPVVDQHLAPILNTVVGHIWGYYAALVINDGSVFLNKFRNDLQRIIDHHTEKGLNVYEIILEDNFKKRIALFYRDFRLKKMKNRFPSDLAVVDDLTLLLKYLMGRLPVSDFDMDFGKKGTALNMLNILFEKLGDSINNMSRPVDAIKHQAKTVTVGTSRISEKVEGMIFDYFAKYKLKLSHLANKNVLVLKNLQEIILQINGAILYEITGLNILGEPTDETTIKVIKKDGVLANVPSRAEKNTILAGTKKIIIQKGNVFIGKGRSDDRRFIVIPLISGFKKTPNVIDNLLLLNISLKERVSLGVKIKALGGKYGHIKSIVQESNVKWEDTFLDNIDMHTLFGQSAEKVGESIVTVNES